MSAHVRPSSGVGFANQAAALEAQYHRMLWCYPRGWRRERGAELVSVLMDVALADGRSRPTVQDRVDLVVHGLLARWEALCPGVPVRVRDRASDASAVLLMGVIACAVVLGEVWAWRAPPPEPWKGIGPTTAQVPLVLLLVAFGCRVAGWRITAQVLYLVGAVAAPAAVAAGKLFELDRPPAPLMLAVAAAAAAAGCSAPMHRSRDRARLALAGAAASGYLLAFVTLSSPMLSFPPFIVSKYFYFVQGPTLMLGGVLWVTLPLLMVALWASRHRRDLHLAMVLGVAAAPWWVLWFGVMADRVFAVREVAALTVLPTVSALLALLATATITARASAARRTEKLRPSP